MGRPGHPGGCPDDATPGIDPADWLLTQAERGNPGTRLDDAHPGERGLVGGQPGPPADPRRDVLRRALRAPRGHPRGRPRLLHRLAGRRRRAAHRRAGQRGRRGAGPRRRARGRRPRPGLALALGGARLHLRARTASSASDLQAPRRRGAARHAGAHRRLAPPEDGGDPAPRRPDARHRLRRRHRPVPLPPRRRRPPRRPAGASSWPRSTAPRRRGTTSRPRSAGRPCTTSRPSSGSAGRTRPRSAAARCATSRTGCRGLDISPDPLPEQAPPPPAGRRRHPRRPAAADLPGPAARTATTRSPAAASAAWPAATPRRVERARRLVYVEDQYLWGHHVGNVFTEALRDNPDLHVVAVVPLFPDLDGASRHAAAARPAPRDARDDAGRARPGRGLRHREPRRHAGLRARQDLHRRRHLGHASARTTSTGAPGPTTPSCPRSWSSAADADVRPRRLRLTLAAEHLDRPSTSGGRSRRGDGRLRGAGRDVRRLRATPRRGSTRGTTAGRAGPRPAGTAPTTVPAGARPGEPGARAGAVPPAARPGRPAAPAAPAQRVTEARDPAQRELRPGST